MDITGADLFAGGGGTTTGLLSVPGIKVLWALNHDETAIKTHAANHPETKHYQADIRTQNVSELERVDFLWASLECTEHSKAKGGKSKNIGSFTLGWELLRYLLHCQPKYLIIENVQEFIRWGELKNGTRVKDKEGQEFHRWVEKIKSAGWPNYSHHFLNAADYGAPTRRIRYIGIFSKEEYPILFPDQTHHEHENNLFGLPKWKACKDFINLNNEGTSIFGREHNFNLPKHLRRQLSKNTLRRIAGGIKKFAPDIYFVMKYYGNGDNCQSLREPLHTLRTKESHTLIKVEKLQFITDHCWLDHYQKTDETLKTIMCRQTKELITTKFHFISSQYNSNGKPELNNKGIDKPLNTITTEEKFQFITTFMTNKDERFRQDKGANRNIVDFDIKMRFLTVEEQASIMGFPEGYFHKEGLKLNNKKIQKMIGNAVPTLLAKAIIEPIYDILREFERQTV